MCWYRKALTSPTNDSFLRIDLERLAFITEHVAFDENRNIVQVPDWASLVGAMADFEPAPIDDEPIESDPAFDTWLEQVGGGSFSSPAPQSLTYEQLSEPCGGCTAYCCKYLVFPGYTPSTTSSFDFMRFVLGFPGSEICVSDRDWSLLVKAQCRHLQEDRCGVYGQPERPLICRYYDAHTCDYKAQLGEVRPPGLVRVRLEQWASVVELFRFDGSGVVVSGPTTEELREHVETRWRERVRAADAAGVPPAAP